MFCDPHFILCRFLKLLFLSLSFLDSTDSLFFDSYDCSHGAQINIILGAFAIRSTLAKLIITAFFSFFLILIGKFTENVSQHIALCLYWMSYRCLASEMKISSFIEIRRSSWFVVRRLNSPRCHAFSFKHCLPLFFPPQFDLLNFLEDNPIVIKGITYSTSHKFPFFSCETYFLFLLMIIVTSVGCFNCVDKRNVIGS